MDNPVSQQCWLSWANYFVHLVCVSALCPTFRAYWKWLLLSLSNFLYTFLWYKSRILWQLLCLLLFRSLHCNNLLKSFYWEGSSSTSSGMLYRCWQSRGGTRWFCRRDKLRNWRLWCSGKVRWVGSWQTLQDVRFGEQWCVPIWSRHSKQILHQWYERRGVWRRYRQGREYVRVFLRSVLRVTFTSFFNRSIDILLNIEGGSWES